MSESTKMKRLRIRAVTTIVGERVVNAETQEAAVVEIRRLLESAGFSSPFVGREVQVTHSIYVQEVLE